MLKEKIKNIAFLDLHAQRQYLGDKIPHAIEKVLDHGNYILGPEVIELEEKLRAYTQAEDVITCGNGTDALRLLLMTHKIGPGDAVFVPTFTFASTAEVVADSKATPVFIDICPHTFNMDPNSLQQAIETLDKKLTPRGIIAVDLFGLPAEYSTIQEIADKYQLWVIADAAQSFGGAIKDKKVGSLAQVTATSFFPSKPLSCYGDGGAIFTNDKNLGNLIRSLRHHGTGKHRYEFIHIGLNSRLDTLQAAILLEKLKVFPNELKRRQAIAQFYNNALQEIVHTPIPPKHMSHAYGLYTIGCQSSQREKLIDALQENGVPTNVYYRKPLHLQPAYAHFPRAQTKLKNAELICDKVLSLPMHPYLTDEQLEYIVMQVKKALC
jgi:dTDP-4-amino-4,6-dideoxygalactose transaminase